MTNFRTDPKTVFAILCLASFASILPMIFFHVTGDWMQQSAFINCFGSQFWQGDLYPRWCFEMNGGLGAPYFIFYFPLPFYLTTLFYPLTWLGAGTYQIFIICCFVATLVTAGGAFSWLSDIVPRGYALLAAILLLWIPYRMELLVFRVAYSELWGVAMLPFIFKYVRQLTVGERDAWWKLAWVWAALAMIHQPAFFASTVASGIYVLIMAWKRFDVWKRMALAWLMGVAVAAFFLVPAFYYKRYVGAEDVMTGTLPWSIDFLKSTLITVHGQLVLTTFIGLTILGLCLSAAALAVKRARIDGAFDRRELFAWIAILATTLFLIFPISSFIYAQLGPLNHVAQPRRMMALFVPCFGYFAAMLMRYVCGARKTWKADYGLALAFLMLASYATLQTWAPEGKAFLQRILQSECAVYTAYRPRWVDYAHWSSDFILRRLNHHPAQAQIIEGKGSVKVEHWKWDGITLATDSKRAMRLKLDHTYFPTWLVTMDNATPLDLLPDENSGQMLLDIPAGAHRITLRHTIFAEHPWLMRLAWLVSIFAAAFLLRVMHGKHRLSFDKPAHK